MGSMQIVVRAQPRRIERLVMQCGNQRAIDKFHAAKNVWLKRHYKCWGRSTGKYRYQNPGSGCIIPRMLTSNIPPHHFHEMLRDGPHGRGIIGSMAMLPSPEGWITPLKPSSLKCMGLVTWMWATYHGYRAVFASDHQVRDPLAAEQASARIGNVIHRATHANTHAGQHPGHETHILDGGTSRIQCLSIPADP